MSGEENQALLIRWFDAVNQGDISVLNDLADELFTPNFMEHDPSMPYFIPGPAGVKQLVSDVREKYSSVQATVHDIVAQDNKVAYRYTMSLMEAGSGKAVDVQLLAIIRFEGGKIAEEWQLGTRGKW